MLTRELLRYKGRQQLKPAFVPPDDPEALTLAENLLAVYRDGAAMHMRRGEIDELTDVLVKGAKDAKFAAGLNKLIQDRAGFETPQVIDYAAERRKLFTASAVALAAAGGELERYREQLLAVEGLADFLAADIYGDLPDNERMTGLRALTAKELLLRYNLALVQGLLFYAEKLRITVADPNPAELRRLFKYLKFFRLLADITRSKPKRGAAKVTRLEIEISGPYALFANTRKYALQLAAFFPAVVNLAEWSFDAEIRLPKGAGRLKLDQSAGLVSHYRNFSAYVPEEIRMFHQLFKEQVTEWTITGDAPFLECEGQEVIFPDLSFTHASGRVLHLELFHRWHRGQLDRRLAYLDRNPDLPLLLGIDRALADDQGYAALEQQFPQLAPRLFRFRDFPGVDRVRRKLDLLLTD